MTEPRYATRHAAPKNRLAAPFAIVAIIACIGLVAFMVFPPYLTFKDLAQERALEAAASEAQSRLDRAFTNALLAGESCQAARDQLGEISIYEDPHTDGLLKGMWSIRKIDFQPDTDACALHLLGTYDDVEGMEVTVPLALPVCPAVAPAPMQEEPDDTGADEAGAEEAPEAEAATPPAP